MIMTLGIALHAAVDLVGTFVLVAALVALALHMLDVIKIEMSAKGARDDDQA